MAFGINASNATKCKSYEDCIQLFMKPGPLKRMGWTEDMRPLDGARKHHMRVGRGPEGQYFDVILYQTAMARYYRPRLHNGVDKREVFYNVHGSQSSSTFQWYVLGFGASCFIKRTTDGRRVLVGMNPDAAGKFPVQLHFANHQLVVESSYDAPAELPATTSPERKAERKEFKKWLRTYEAMSKVVPIGGTYSQWSLVALVKHAYITKELFDPTTLCTYICHNGVQAVVDAVYPLGDVKNYNPSFKELT